MLNENVVTFSVAPGSSHGSPAVVSFQNPADSFAVDVVNTAITGTSSSENTINVFWEVLLAQDKTIKLLQVGQSAIYIEGNIPIDASPSIQQPAIVNSTDYFLR